MKGKGLDGYKASVSEMRGNIAYNRSLSFKLCPSINPVIHIWVLRAKWGEQKTNNYPKISLLGEACNKESCEKGEKHSIQSIFLASYCMVQLWYLLTGFCSARSGGQVSSQISDSPA